MNLPNPYDSNEFDNAKPTMNFWRTKRGRRLTGVYVFLAGLAFASLAYIAGHFLGQNIIASILMFISASLIMLGLSAIVDD